MPAVVLDINVLVSALINRRSPPGRIRAAWQRKELDLIASHAIIAKTDEVLHRPSISTLLATVYSEAQAKIQIQRLLYALRHQAYITPGTLNLQVVEADPEDDTIIIAAVEGKADCIISGDRHLKNLGSYQNIPILSPVEFVGQYHI